jgi:predicted cation transporter
MNEGLFIIGGLSLVMVLVLFLPFLSKRVEEDLEIFLFIMGVVSLSISRLWSWNLLNEALIEPIKITLAVLIAGFMFRALRSKIANYTIALRDRFGIRVLVFIIVVALGLISSVITAIIAALILSEVISVLNLSKKYELKIVVISCFSIGLGAALTPIGEPLATIAISRLRGEPHYADFLFLFRSLGKLVIPGIFMLGIYAAFLKGSTESQNSLKKEKPETTPNVIFRAFKIYLFVLALIFLGTGFTPIVEKYVVNIPVPILYWFNTVSAVLDNATLTAAEISPQMTVEKIRFMLIGLLIAGGMLIPGNIPNIICANKLSIKSKEWAKLGVPIGIALMVVYFILLTCEV